MPRDQNTKRRERQEITEKLYQEDPNINRHKNKSVAVKQNENQLTVIKEGLTRNMMREYESACRPGAPIEPSDLVTTRNQRAT